ncbi:SAM-dependent methyltransferase [Desulfosalsimonas propionicica]|uniref:SAM-dependent methyltransferase n=1 Tax=Desulfosalsimonas propionicica TaxID=332175 RepID=A0A7W0C8I1_9BACT|nr:class I SAM-dependent methyltransferase [Desulfosalsimonas propionicica]MBA2881101.1 SAM-dependent methyltransferase [Desulfosalsimonas propionicica]
MTFPAGCPLCGQTKTEKYTEDRFRKYRLCTRCHLVFVPGKYHVSEAREKARYDEHNNDPNDPGYRKFLSRMAEPLCKKLPFGASGLDFGCGPGPALAAMLREQGFDTAVYDKFYTPDGRVLEKTYDFITATEVLEHLRRPGKDIDRLWQILRPGGIFGIMTKLVKDKAAFDNWHYKRDPTHVCFFSAETLLWLGDFFRAQVEFINSDVVLLYK